MGHCLYCDVIAHFIIYQGGVEGIGRLSEIIGPIVLLMITFVIILNVGNMNWDYMRPIYHDSGWLPILKGSYTPVAAFLRGCYDDDVRFLYG